MCRLGLVIRIAGISSRYKQFRMIERKPSGWSASDKNVMTIKQPVQA